MMKLIGLDSPQCAQCCVAACFLTEIPEHRLGWAVLAATIALPLDSLLLRGVCPRPCFYLRARRHARPLDGVKTRSCTDAMQ